MTSAADVAEAYRKADLRLRLLLFGDGSTRLRSYEERHRGSA